uniref:Uncharacterized protein n=1 Tax=Rhabditophanes sp. KR3021 TaxID=114890 RepID=A0AC35THV9_9BILA
MKIIMDATKRTPIPGIESILLNNNTKLSREEDNNTITSRPNESEHKKWLHPDTHKGNENDGYYKTNELAAGIPNQNQQQPNNYELNQSKIDSNQTNTPTTNLI